jgi:hypothetical protein
LQGEQLSLGNVEAAGCIADTHGRMRVEEAAPSSEEFFAVQPPGLHVMGN